MFPVYMMPVREAHGKWVDNTGNMSFAKFELPSLKVNEAVD